MREKERKRNINVWLPPTWPPLGTQPATQACALTWNQTGDPLACSPHSIHWAILARALGSNAHMIRMLTLQQCGKPDKLKNHPTANIQRCFIVQQTHFYMHRWSYKKIRDTNRAKDGGNWILSLETMHGSQGLYCCLFLYVEYGAPGLNGLCVTGTSWGSRTETSVWIF